MSFTYDRSRQQNSLYNNLTPLSEKLNPRNLNNSKLNASVDKEHENVASYHSTPILSKGLRKTKNNSMSQIELKNTPRKEDSYEKNHHSNERTNTEPNSAPGAGPLDIYNVKDLNALTDQDVEVELKETLNELEPVLQSDIDKININSPLLGTQPIMKCVVHILKPQIFKKISKKTEKEITDWTRTIQAMLVNKNFIQNVTYFNNELDEESFKKIEEIFKKEPKNLRLERVKLVNNNCLSLFKWICVQKKIYFLRQLYIKSMTNGPESFEPQQGNTNIESNKNLDKFNDSFGAPNSGDKKSPESPKLDHNDQMYNKETQFLNKIDKQLKLAKGLLNHIDNHEWSEQATVKSPPAILILIFEALCHIFKPDLALSKDGTVDFWLSSKVFLVDKTKFFDRIISFNPETQMDYDTYIKLLELGDKNPQLHNLEYDERAPPLISGLYTWISAQINIYYLMNIHYKNLDKEILNARFRAHQREELVKTNEIIVEERDSEDSFENLDIRKEEQPEIEEVTNIVKENDQDFEVTSNLIKKDSEQVLESKESDTLITETQQSVHESRNDINFYDSIKKNENSDIVEAVKRYNYYKTQINKESIEEVKANCFESEVAMKVLQALCYVFKSPILKRTDHYENEVNDMEASIRNLLFDKKFLSRISEYNYLLHLDDEIYFKLKTFLQENDDLIRPEDASVNDFFNGIFILYEWLKSLKEVFYLSEKIKLTSADAKVDSIKKSNKQIKKKKPTSVVTSNNTLKTGANKSNNKRSNQKLPQETSTDNLIDGARKSKREQVSSLNNRNLIKNSGIPRGSVDKDEHCNRNLHILGGSTDKKSVTNINRSKVNSGSKKIDAVKKTERASQKYLTKLELQSDIKNKEIEVENKTKNQMANLKTEKEALLLKVEQLKQQVGTAKGNLHSLNENNKLLSQRNKYLNQELNEYDRCNDILIDNCDNFFGVIKDVLDNLPTKKLRKTFPPKLCKALENFETSTSEFQKGLSCHVEVINENMVKRQEYTEIDIVEVNIEMNDELLDDEPRKSETPKFQSDEEFEIQADKQEILVEINPTPALAKKEKNSSMQKKKRQNSNLMEQINKAELNKSNPKQRLINETPETEIFEEPNNFKQTFGENGEYFESNVMLNNIVKPKENSVHSATKSYSDLANVSEEDRAFFRAQQRKLEEQAESQQKDKDSIRSKKNSSIGLNNDGTPYSPDYATRIKMDMYPDASNPRPFSQGNVPQMGVYGSSYVPNQNDKSQFKNGMDFEQAHEMMMDSMLNSAYNQQPGAYNQPPGGLMQNSYKLLGQNNIVNSEIMMSEIIDENGNARDTIGSNNMGGNMKRETYLVKNPGHSLGIDFNQNAAYRTEPNLRISELSMEESYPAQHKDSNYGNLKKTDSAYASEQFMNQENAEKRFSSEIQTDQNLMQAYNHFSKDTYVPPAPENCYGRDTFPAIKQDFIRINSLSNKSNTDDEKKQQQAAKEKAVTDRSERNNPKGNRVTKKGSGKKTKIGSALENVSKTFRK